MLGPLTLYFSFGAHNESRSKRSTVQKLVTNAISLNQSTILWSFLELPTLPRLPPTEYKVQGSRHLTP
eukprot:1159886-Pelagomonas_calceolata.AAC.4